MTIAVVTGDTLYRIATSNGASHQDAIILPQGSTSNVRLGSETNAIFPGDQVLLTQGPPVVINGPTDTLYSIARENGLDNWQDLIILRGRELHHAGSLPRGLQPGDHVYIEFAGNCCIVAEESPTPTSEAEQAATEEGSGIDVEETTQTCDTRRVIVIDPGHGGTISLRSSSWNNAISHSGTLEKTLTLKFAKSLKAKLETSEVQDLAERKGYCDLEVLMTREEDVNLSASARRAIAGDNSADIFISIHFNGFNGNVRGTETFYRHSSGEQQNNSSEDINLATTVQRYLFNAMSEISPGARDRGVKYDREGARRGISVLRDPGTGFSGKMCRSILTEIEFIDNPAVDELIVSGDNVFANIDHLMLNLARGLIEAL